MGETAGDTQQGGSNKAVVKENFKVGGAAGASVWVGNVGGVPENGVGIERVHPWGGEMDNRKTTTEREGWEVVSPLTGGGHEGSGDHRRTNANNRRQNMVTQYIATRPLLDFCEGAKQREEARVPMRWWDQTGIYWEKVLLFL